MNKFNYINISLLSLLYVNFAGGMEYSCGPQSVASILKHLNKDMNVDKIYQLFENPYSQIITAEELKTVVENLGYTFKGIKTDYDGLLANYVPCIVHLQSSQHYAVVNRIDKSMISILEQSDTDLILSRQQFESIWSNNAFYIWDNQLEDGGLVTANLVSFPIETKLSHDIEIKQDELFVDYALELQNQTKNNIDLDFLKPSCGCIEIIDAPNSINSQDTLFVLLRFYPKLANSKTISLSMKNNDFQYIYQFHLVELPYLDCGLNSMNLGNIDIINLSEKNRYCFDVNVKGLEPLMADRLIVNSSIDMDYEIKHLEYESHHSKKLNYLTVKVCFNPINYVGMKHFTLELKRKDQFQYNEIVNINCNVNGYISMMPNYFHMLPHADNLIGSKILLRSSAKTPLTFQFDQLSSHFSSKVIQHKDNTYEIYLYYLMDSIDDSKQESINIITNDVYQNVINIPVKYDISCFK